jgi:hypothetical protein
MDTNTRLVRMFVALAAAFGLLLAPITASAAPAADRTVAAKPAKVTAKADKTKVKVGEDVKLSGALELDSADRALQVVVVQQLQAGVWVDLTNTTCTPSYRYKATLSFSVAVQTQLRVYYPGTSVYASATSQVIGLVVS